MRFGYYAFKDGDSEEYQIIFKVELSATGWAFERTRELFEKVAKDEPGSLSIVQGIVEEDRFPVAYPRTSRRTVGIYRKEALQLVVRNLRRKR